MTPTATPTLTPSPTATPCDPYEPGDDAYTSAHAVAVGGAASSWLLSTSGDADWFTFNVVAGQQYTIVVGSPGTDVDPILDLFDAAGAAGGGAVGNLASADAYGLGGADGTGTTSGNPETAVWTATFTGPVYLRVTNFQPTFGCGAGGYGYDVSVTSP
jgi:hypothetical protein